VNQTVYDFQLSALDQKYPEFKYLMQEYHDGILLFNISDMMVWSKASNDSVGLGNFYQKNKESYRWGERVHYAVYTCDDEKLLMKASKGIASAKMKGVKPEDFIAKLNKGSKQVVTRSSFVAIPDDKEVLDFKSWSGSISPSAKKDKFSFKELIEVTNGDIKDLSDCKGQVISDYQQSLEEEWLKSLRLKYPVEVNQDALKNLVDDLGKK